LDSSRKSKIGNLKSSGARQEPPLGPTGDNRSGTRSPEEPGGRLTTAAGAGQNRSGLRKGFFFMASFDIVSRVDLQEADNAVNVARKTILTRYDFRTSKTEITLDKKEKKIRVVTEDEMKMRAVQESLVENFVRRKIDPKALEAKETQPASGGMIQREIAIKEGVDTDTARTIVKLIRGLNLKVQAAIQDQQVRVTGKQIDDLQTVIQAVRAANIGVPLQFSNMAR
jgi:hypothetical protein